MRNIYVTGSTGRSSRSPNSNLKHQVIKVHFFHSQINTVVTSSASVIKRWIESIEHFSFRGRRRQQAQGNNIVVGLGVQWFPRRHRADPADILQLCVANRCLIIQLSHTRSVPVILRRFLGNSNYKFVGIQNSTDARKLRTSVHNLSVSKLIDLADSSTRKKPTMAIMACDFLGLKGVGKDVLVGMSRWNAKLLNQAQIEYACVDAHVSFLIAKELKI